MPDYRRWRFPGGTYFLTINLLERHADCWSGISMRCAERAASGRSISMPGRCCRSLCTASSRSRRAAQTFPTESRR